ncbi:MAG: ABC transporter ATP-binding protein, partial [Polynucleobacter victoriensis]
LTTHYLEEAQESCGRIAMLKKGEIVALDTTVNLLARVNNSQNKDGDLEDVFMQIMSEGR